MCWISRYDIYAVGISDYYYDDDRLEMISFS